MKRAKKKNFVPMLARWVGATLLIAACSTEDVVKKGPLGKAGPLAVLSQGILAAQDEVQKNIDNSTKSVEKGATKISTVGISMFNKAQRGLDKAAKPNLAGFFPKVAKGDPEERSYTIDKIYVAPNGTHACALNSEPVVINGQTYHRADRVICWGDNRLGQVGPLNQDISGPQEIDPALLGTRDGTHKIISLTLGEGFTCALIAPTDQFEGKIKCWGDLNQVFKGGGPVKYELNDTRDENGRRIAQLYSTVQLAYFDLDRVVRSGNQYQVINGALLPDKAPRISGPTDLSVTAFLKLDRDPNYLDDFNIQNKNVTVDRFTSMVASSDNICVQTASDARDRGIAKGDLICWGGNFWGQLGIDPYLVNCHNNTRGNGGDPGNLESPTRKARSFQCPPYEDGQNIDAKYDVRRTQYTAVVMSSLNEAVSEYRSSRQGTTIRANVISSYFSNGTITCAVGFVGRNFFNSIIRCVGALHPERIREDFTSRDLGMPDLSSDADSQPIEYFKKTSTCHEIRQVANKPLYNCNASLLSISGSSSASTCALIQAYRPADDIYTPGRIPAGNRATCPIIDPDSLTIIDLPQVNRSVAKAQGSGKLSCALYIGGNTGGGATCIGEVVDVSYTETEVASGEYRTDLGGRTKVSDRVPGRTGSWGTIPEQKSLNELLNFGIADFSLGSEVICWIADNKSTISCRGLNERVRQVTIPDGEKIANPLDVPMIIPPDGIIWKNSGFFTALGSGFGDAGKITQGDVTSSIKGNTSTRISGKYPIRIVGATYGAAKDITLVASDWLANKVISIPPSIYDIPGVGDIVPTVRKSVFLTVKKPDGNFETRAFIEESSDRIWALDSSGSQTPQIIAAAYGVSIDITQKSLGWMKDGTLTVPAAIHTAVGSDPAIGRSKLAIISIQLADGTFINRTVPEGASQRWAVGSTLLVAAIYGVEKDITTTAKSWLSVDPKGIIAIPQWIYSLEGVGDVAPLIPKSVFVTVQKADRSIVTRSFAEGTAATWNIGGGSFTPQVISAVYGASKDITSVVGDWQSGSTITVPLAIKSLSGVGDPAGGFVGARSVVLIIKEANGTYSSRTVIEGPN